jgi:transposase-like protein
MPHTRQVHLNDNIRTEHLKCPICRTRTYLVQIESERDGSEIRFFGCPRCSAQRVVRVAASLAVRRGPDLHATPVMA